MKTVAPNSHQTIQRVKVGMVGLAAVILLIGLASAIFSAADRERTVAVGGSNVAAAKVVANAADPANEPLAELGVAPSADVNTSAPAGKR
jgi:hypothetical protein